MAVAERRSNVARNYGDRLPDVVMQVRGVDTEKIVACLTGHP